MNSVSLAATILGVLIGVPVGTAFTPLVWDKPGERSLSLDTAIENARTQTDWRLWQELKELFSSELPRRRRTSSDDEWGKFIIVGGIVVWLVYLYAIHALIVATVLAAAAATVALATVVTFGVLYWRRVVDGRATAVGLLMLFLYVLAGITSAIWLLTPPMHPVLAQFLSRVDVTDLTFTAALQAALVASQVEVPALLLQAFGALVAFFVLISGLALCGASVSSVYVTLNVRGSRFWRVSFWLVRWSTGHAKWMLALLAVLSLALTSGLILEVVIQGGELVQAFADSQRQT